MKSEQAFIEETIAHVLKYQLDDMHNMGIVLPFASKGIYPALAGLIYSEIELAKAEYWRREEVMHDEEVARSGHAD